MKNGCKVPRVPDPQASAPESSDPVAPVGLRIKGEYCSDFGGLGGGDTEGSFTRIEAYFKKAVEAPAKKK